jgi:predicted unusual protein kinase regulating ubiquinone biosynthesis (AarF/ABC1/UbiB family)
MSDDALIRSALGRFLKLSGLAGRVGLSVIGDRAGALGRSGTDAEMRRERNLIRNATRIAETLGEMKGAAMKVGQMLSLHEGLLPPEAAEVLRGLQREAPQVPPEVMGYEVEGAFQQPLTELFSEFDPEAHAAASIGQVHRGKLADGRPVAIKIQYPLIDEIVRADLKNLKLLLGSLVGLVLDIDFEPIWREVRDRLLEELDYEHEAANMRRMAELNAGRPEIIVPTVVPERTCRRVLTMELVDGIPPERACSNEFPQELRSRWGTVLFEFLLRGLVEHRFLHSDPNLSNFAFRPDGRVVVYDCGNVKRVPPEIAEGYKRIFRLALDGRREEVPKALDAMGVHRGDGSTLERDLVDPYYDLFSQVVRKTPPYVFGEDADLYDKLIELGWSNWSRAADIRFPEDMVFVSRTLGGHLGNLIRLRASGPWHELVRKYTA